MKKNKAMPENNPARQTMRQMKTTSPLSFFQNKSSDTSQNKKTSGIGNDALSLQGMQDFIAESDLAFKSYLKHFEEKTQENAQDGQACLGLALANWQLKRAAPALHAVEKARSLMPEDTESLFLHHRILCALGKFQRAKKILLEFGKLYPDTRQVWKTLLENTCAHDGDNNQIVTLQSAFDMGCRIPAVLIHLCALYIGQKKKDNAQPIVDYIRAAFPQNRMGNILQGHIHLLNGHIAAALKIAAQFMEQDKNFAEAFVLAAKCTEAKNQPVKTLALITEGLKHNPQNGELLYLMASRTQQKSRESALPHWQNLLDNAPNIFMRTGWIMRAHSEIAQHKMNLGLWQEAAEHLAYITEKDKKNTPAAIHRAACLVNLRLTRPAKECLETAIKTNKNKPELLGALLKILILRNEQKAADSLAAQVDKLKSHPPETCEIMAQYWFEKNSTEKAMTWAIKALNKNPAHPERMLAYAQSLARSGGFPAALPLLKTVAQSEPKNGMLLFQIADIFMQAKDYLHAAKYYTNSMAHMPYDHRPALLLAKIYAMQDNLPRAIQTLKGYHTRYGANAETHMNLGIYLSRNGQDDDAIHAHTQAIQIADIFAPCWTDMAKIHLRNNRQDMALECLNGALNISPKNVNALRLRARISMQKGFFDDALADAELAESVRPAALAEQGMLRMLRDIIEENRPISLRFISSAPMSAPLSTPLRTVTEFYTAALSDCARISLSDANIFKALDELPLVEDKETNAEASAWLLYLPRIISGTHKAGDCDAPHPLREHIQTALYRINSQLHKLARISYVVLPDGAALVSTSVLREIATHAPKQTIKNIDSLMDYARPIMRQWDLSDPHTKTAMDITRDMPPATDAPDETMPSNTVFLVSPKGASLFGGVEHFMRSMAKLWKNFGYHPVIVGMHGEEDSGHVEGIEFVHISAQASALRTLALTRRPAFVQAMSGCGFATLEALKGLSSKFIFGIHFWREPFHGEGAYPDIDRHAEPREEFSLIIRHADAIYANSVFTQEMITRYFNICPPLLPSVPEEKSVPWANKPGDKIILMNASPAKGLNLMCDVAALCPQYKFVGMSTQTDIERAEMLVKEKALKNIEIRPHTNDLDALYKEARIVVVPSYSFIETFSRVCIEAQRYGRPVIGSDRGNVPYLLEKSGCILPEDAHLWAQEISRLMDDNTAWKDAHKKATKNAANWTFTKQKTRLSNIIRGCKRPVMMAFGAGIGNMVQVSPAIARLSAQLAQPVDLLLYQDWSGCEVLFAGHDSAGHIFVQDEHSPQSHISYRHYDAAIYLYTFGRAGLPIDAGYTLDAGDALPFEATKSMPEVEYYLQSIADVTGLPFKKSDTQKLFVGNFTYTPPPQDKKSKAKRMVVHAGSKNGVWAAKKWPHFKDFIQKAQKQKWDVISVGGTDEYIDGTIDATGQPLDGTIQTILSANIVVANDSGLMHVADGLNVPLIAIFGPTCTRKNGPVSKNSHIIALEKECSPCQFNAEQLKTCACIGDIPLATVWDAFQNMAKTHTLKPENSKTKLKSKNKHTG